MDARIYGFGQQLLLTFLSPAWAMRASIVKADITCNQFAQTVNEMTPRVGSVFMRRAETVSFGGSGLNRAAELRSNSDRIDEMLSDARTRIFPLWRGRVLIADDMQTPTACWVDPKHDLANLKQDQLIFLGFDDGCACFATDVSSWVPAGFDPDAFASFSDPNTYHHPALPDGQTFVELRAVMARLSARDAELLATAKAVQSWHASHGYCATCGGESVISHSGWQRDCPACKTPHFPRTDPVVIMLITHGNDVLMGRSPGWPEGMYSLLAGFVEPGETIEAAVRREVKEESGVDVGAVSYLASQPWAFPSSLMFGCAGEATSREITIDPNEIEDALWVSREDIALAFSGNHPTILPARAGAIAHFLLLNWLSDTLR